MANVFVHFEPIGAFGEETIKVNNDLPSYVVPGTFSLHPKDKVCCTII